MGYNDYPRMNSLHSFYGLWLYESYLSYCKYIQCIYYQKQLFMLDIFA